MNTMKYPPYEIELIINHGTIKRKARLYLRDRMGYSGTGFILNYETIDRLVLSVQEDKREEWDKYISFGLRLENAFKDLSRLVLRIQNAREELQNDLIDIMDIERSEENFNKLLVPFDYGETLDSGQMTDIGPQKSQVHRVNLKGYIRTTPNFREDGFLDVSLFEGNSAPFKRAEEDLTQLRDLVNQFVQYETAMYKRIKESKLDIPEYEEVMERNREEVEQEVSLCPRWVGYQDNRLRRIRTMRFDAHQNPLPALRNIKKVYLVKPQFFEPDRKEIKKIYNQI